MDDVIQKMTSRLSVERLMCVVEEMEAAARAGDPVLLSRLDHALRSAALAVIGTVPHADTPPQEQIDALRDALAALDATVSTLTLKQRAVKVQRQKAQHLRLAYTRGDGMK